MEQTRVEQFFPARRRNKTSHPSKRLKLDPSAVKQTTTSTKKSKTVVSSKTAKAKKVNINTISGLLTAKPIVESTSSTKDDHSKTIVRKTKIEFDPESIALLSNRQPPTKELNTPFLTPTKVGMSPCKTSGETSKNIEVGNNARAECPLPQNDWVNEQAINVLHSRGTAILRASKIKALESRSPTKTPSSTSKVFLSPSKLLTPTKENGTKLTSEKPIVSLRSQEKRSRRLSGLLDDHLAFALSAASPSKSPAKALFASPAKKALFPEDDKDDEPRELSPPRDEAPLKAPAREEAPAAPTREPVQESTLSAPSRNRLKNKFAHLVGSNQPTITPLSAPTVVETNKQKIKTPVKLEASPAKVPLSRARDRYKDITVKEAPSTLKLPQKFKLLLEAFKCSDSVLFLLNQRKEVCTFDRLKQSVQKMTSKDFTAKHLGMMKTVYPAAFKFRQEKGLHRVSGGKNQDYQMTIESNFDLALCKKDAPLSSTVLITRRLAFENNLLDITKQHHQKFIRKLNLNLSDAEIHRWHPNFKLDDVPQVEAAVLPQAPVQKGFTSAADMIAKSRGLATKVVNALEKAAGCGYKPEGGNDPDATIVAQEITPSPVPAKEASTPTPKNKNDSKNSNLKGVSQSLLDRIRQKEQQKAAIQMTRDPEKEKRLAMLERLPEISRIINSYFVTEKKAAIALEDCLTKLKDSYGSAISIVQLDEHVKLLASLVPKWLLTPVVRKQSYLKLAKGLDINHVLNELQIIKKREEETAS